MSLADLMQKQAELNRQMAQLLEKDADGTVDYTLLHGLGGLFSTPGLERDVVTAHIRPRGIGSALPLLPSVDEDPRFGVITGYTADVGTRITNPCDDAPYNYMKACTLTARFGLTRRDTKEIDIGAVMKKVNRGDFTDLLLRGRVLGLSGLTPNGLNENQIMSIVTMSEMVGAAVAAERELSVDMWQGTIATGAFPGLDSQIATGHVDADTNTACPAVDSDVKDFTYEDIEGSTKSIVHYMQTMEKYLRFNAERMGLDPVSYVITMRPELWEVLTEVWPCQYNTNKCASSVQGTSTVFIDGRENISERDAMRANMTLDLNGNSYRVVLDDGIYEQNNINDGNLAAGEYASSIYFVPVTINGSFPVTYRQYLNYSAWDSDVSLLRGKEDFWTDGGVYSWAITQTKWCYTLHLRSEQRIVLRTPHLAGKIQNVKYVPLQHLRSPYPDSPYFNDGGVSYRASSSYNAVWG